MSAWIYFRGHGCPICGDVRTDCRQSPSGTIHCRAGENAPNGWQFKGTDLIGFGLYVPNTSNHAHRFSKQYPSNKQTKKKASAPKTNAARFRKEVLTREERRNRWLQRIAKRVGLSEAHRAKIEQRGVPSETIDRWHQQGLLFTWPAGETFGIQPIIPGTNAYNRFVNIPGFAIAIPDIDGNLIGAQIKADEDGSYRWASGKYDIKLPNGENPIGVYGSRSTELNFAEGYLKSAIAADRFDLFVVGSSGGAWANSPDQLSAIIAAVGAKTFVLNVDGC